ncbi:MAG: ABC transporter substrate-binding protein [Clostridiales bacterium]
MNLKLKNTIILFFLFFLNIVFIISCNKNSDTNNKENKELSGNIILWHYDKNEANEIIKNYKNINKDSKITVKIKEINKSKYLDLLKKTLKSNSDDKPDIVVSDKENLFSIVNLKNCLEDLDNKKYNFNLYSNNMYEYSIESSKDEKGKQRAMGIEIDPGAIIYKKDLARKYLGRADEKNVTEFFSEYESIIETGKKLKEKSNDECKLFTNTNDFLNIYLANRKEGWINDGKLSIDDELDYFMKLTKRIDELNLDSEIKHNSNEWKEAIKDKIHFAFPVSFKKIEDIKKIQNDDLKFIQRWGIVKMQNQFFNNGIWYGIFKSSDKKDLAWEFIKYISTDKNYANKYKSKNDKFWNNISYIETQSKDKTLVSNFNGDNIIKNFSDMIDKKYKNLDTEYDKEINKLFIEYSNIYSKDVEDYYSVINDFKEETDNIIK